MLLKTIGIISSPFIDKFGTPRQSGIAKRTLSTIQLDLQKIPQDMLHGLEVGTYLWVIFGFHLNKQKKTIVKVHPPRLRGRKMGVLATRSPHRPNPMGLSLARIEDIQKGKIIVSGLDLVDKTPVFDIKPYLPIFDRPAKRDLRWIEENPFPQLQVRFGKNVFKALPTSSAQNEHLKLQLKEILREDPRPLAYLEKSDHIYWIKYASWDIGFIIRDKTLTVVELKSLSL